MIAGLVWGEIRLMMALAFLFVVFAILGSVLALEGGANQAALRRPAGLFTWLTSGNWPAKIGGGLLVVGVGALLRYALINFDVAPSIKLTTGVLAAAALGFASMLTHKGAAHRAVSLALGGAAFGIAYLTAYSAFALFGYVTSFTGLGLLALVSVATGVFAVTRSALSLALLAMVGAYLAPAFADTDPGPRIIYGYYIAASALTFAMIMARGWRPLIHLSFLFTLAGGVFFAWTARYYTPEYFGVMGPMLLVLAALHAFMPVVERGSARPGWIERMDLVYILALPAVATLLSVVVAPSRLALSTHLLWLAGIWLAAAAWLQLRNREGVAIHAVIGTLLIGLSVAARFAGLPWELIGLAFSVAALAIAVLRSPSKALHNGLAGLVLLLGAVHIVSSIAPPENATAFTHTLFFERLMGAALLVVAGVLCRRVRQALDTILLSVGIGWALIAIGAEIARWDLVSFALVLHWLLIAAAFAVFFAPRRHLTDSLVIPLAIGIVATALFAAASASGVVPWINLILAPLALLGLALRPADPEDETGGRIAAVIVLPFVAAIWAQYTGDPHASGQGAFAAFVATLAATLTLFAGRLLPARSSGWMRPVTGIFGVVLAAMLAIATLFNIERTLWAALLELSCQAALILLAVPGRGPRPTGDWTGAACVGAALVLQANLLRLLGPPGTLSIADIADMKWPTLVSLLWATMGAVLTVLARGKGSRPLWMGGAALLVAAAIKLILLDFGSLGDLANILAVIAAGGVFLLVGWLAPMPPAAAAEEPQAARSPPAQPAPSQQEAAPAERTADGSGGKLGWTIALLIFIAIVASRCEHPARELLRQLTG
jgi:uncharacterized membrane protein